jgi:hypothetical protein
LLLPFARHDSLSSKGTWIQDMDAIAVRILAAQEILDYMKKKKKLRTPVFF